MGWRVSLALLSTPGGVRSREGADPEWRIVWRWAQGVGTIYSIHLIEHQRPY